MSSVLVTKSHLWMKTHFLFLQLLICKPLQIYPCNDQCPELSTVAYSPLLLPGYFPFIFTYKFWHRCLYCTLIPTFQFSRLTFLFVRGEENTTVWENAGLLDLISRVSFLFLSPFPTRLSYCLCLQKIDQFPKTIMLLYFKSFSSLLTLFIFISLIIYNKRNLWLLLEAAYSEGAIHFAFLEFNSINVIFTQHRFI